MVGAVLMVAGQCAPGVLAGVRRRRSLARILVGIGDALTFVSVIRLLPNWFSGRILPQLAQWVGMLGQLGQIIATVPFALLLHAVGVAARAADRGVVLGARRRGDARTGAGAASHRR